jgi:2-C-methyl-D-erythritol 4-phosphate cytidylyltransferase
MTIGAILLAGGTGSRYHPQQSKLLAALGGQSILVRSVNALLSVSEIDAMVVVAHADWLTTYQALVKETKLIWAIGGATRRQSVYNGLSALPEDVDIVVIHDAARPLITPQKIRAALAPVLSGEAMGTSLGVPLHDSIKLVETGPAAWVQQSLDRHGIWRVHTPQVFRREVIMAAHQQISADIPVTDDAELVERLYPHQHAVRMIEDDATNIKITTPQDLALAHAYLGVMH